MLFSKVSKDFQQAAQVRSKIISETGNPNIHLIAADLSSFQEVVKLSEEFQARFDQIARINIKSVRNQTLFISASFTMT